MATPALGVLVLTPSVVWPVELVVRVTFPGVNDFNPVLSALIALLVELVVLLNVVLVLSGLVDLEPLSIV